MNQAPQHLVGTHEKSPQNAPADPVDHLVIFLEVKMKTKNPTCIHCGYEFDEEETWHGEYQVGKVYTGDCDDSELKCPNLDCGKTFYVRCIHLISFEQIDAEGEEI